MPMSSGRDPPQKAAIKPPGNPEPFYTNEDVAVLHNIVLLAEEILPGLPERERLPTNALFGAYYEILPKVGINADHDSRYARILFKIGGLRGSGTIYEKFEEILSRMGIQIEFDHEEEPYSQSEEDTESIADENPHASRGRQRRNSESSAWDLGTEVPQSDKNRPRSASPRDKPTARIRAGNSLRVSRHVQQLSDPTPSGGQAERDPSKYNIRTWLASSQDKPRRGRERSVSRSRNLQVRRRSPSLKNNHRATVRKYSVESEGFEGASEITAVTSAQEQKTPDSPKLFQGYPSGLMQVNASLILQHHFRLLAKRKLQLWRFKALQSRIDNINRDIISSAHDRKALLQLAVETWHEKLIVKRQIAATVRFFAYLEQRTEAARDNFLLAKAFTHWRERAFDQAERTSVARRHIVRKRTFTAWRDITVVNELKFRRQVIKKFFSVWKCQHDTIKAKAESALQRFEGNLVEKSYRQWVQKRWDIKASILWTEGPKQRILVRWNSMLRYILNDYNVAEDHYRLQLLRKTWQSLNTRTDECKRKEQQAIIVYQLRVCLNAFGKWLGEAQVTPAKIAVQTDVSSRLLRETFGIWLHRSREERRAVAIDRSRILHEAWTTWRHKVRFQLTRAHVNDRVVQIAMYKWLLRARIIFTERKFGRNVLRNCWGDWAQKARLAMERRWDQEDQAEDFARHNVQTLIISRWHITMESQLQRETDALHLCNSKRLRRLLSQWSERTQHLRQLHQWSQDANFYFLASKTLKSWKSSTEAAKREKRKAAYVQIRRVTKMNLAQGILLDWLQQAQRVLELQAQAQEISQNKNMIVGMNIFDRWRARTEELGELESVWREKVLQRHFMLWKDRYSTFQHLEVEAIINYEERQQSRAAKKWSLLTLQLRSRSLSATELRDKNVKRTFRKTFNYWHQRTLQKRPSARAETEQEPHSQLGATARAEEWSDFGDEGEVNEWARGWTHGNPSPPVPGYLSTPSRRMERVSAVAARFSSTTPRAPLSTPFERQLRAQYSGDGLLSARNLPGRSRLGMGGSFPDIIDKEGR